MDIDIKDKADYLAHTDDGALFTGMDFVVPRFKAYSRWGYEKAIMSMAGSDGEYLDEAWRYAEYRAKSKPPSFLPDYLSSFVQTKLIERTQNGDAFITALHHLIRYDIQSISNKTWEKLIDEAIKGDTPHAMPLLYMAAHIGHYALDKNNRINENREHFIPDTKYKEKITHCIHYAMRRFAHPTIRSLFRKKQTNALQQRNAQRVLALFLNSDYLHENMDFSRINVTAAAQKHFNEIAIFKPLHGSKADILLAYINLARSSSFTDNLSKESHLGLINAAYHALPDYAEHMANDHVYLALKSGRPEAVPAYRRQIHRDLRNFAQNVRYTITEVFGALYFMGDSESLFVDTFLSKLEDEPSRILCYPHQITRERQALQTIASLNHQGLPLSPEQAYKLTFLTLKIAPANDLTNNVGRRHNLKPIRILNSTQPSRAENVLAATDYYLRTHASTVPVAEVPTRLQLNLPCDMNTKNDCVLRFVLHQYMLRYHKPSYQRLANQLTKLRHPFYRAETRRFRQYPDNFGPLDLANLLGSAVVPFAENLYAERYLSAKIARSLSTTSARAIGRAGVLIERMQGKQDLKHEDSPYFRANYALDRLEKRVAWAQRQYEKRQALAAQTCDAG